MSLSLLFFFVNYFVKRNMFFFRDKTLQCLFESGYSFADNLRSLIHIRYSTKFLTTRDYFQEIPRHICVWLGVALVQKTFEFLS